MVSVYNTPYVCACGGKEVCITFSMLSMYIYIQREMGWGRGGGGVGGGGTEDKIFLCSKILECTCSYGSALRKKIIAIILIKYLRIKKKKSFVNCLPQCLQFICLPQKGVVVFLPDCGVM